MKSIFLLKCVLASFIFVSPFLVSSQNAIDTIKIGGSHKKSTQYYKAPEKIKLDNAQLSVTYQFTHGVVRNKNISFVTDTMVLVAGSEYSIYFDRNDKNRRVAFSSYFKHEGTPKAFISTPYGEFTEIAVNDNYLFSSSICTFEELRRFRKNKIANMSQGVISSYDLSIYKIKNPVKYHVIETKIDDHEN